MYLYMYGASQCIHTCLFLWTNLKIMFTLLCSVLSVLCLSHDSLYVCTNMYIRAYMYTCMYACCSVEGLSVVLLSWFPTIYSRCTIIVDSSLKSLAVLFVCCCLISDHSGTRLGMRLCIAQCSVSLSLSTGTQQSTLSRPLPSIPPSCAQLLATREERLCYGTEEREGGRGGEGRRGEGRKGASKSME